MFKNLKIGIRLSLGFGFVALLLIAISILGYTRISALNTEIDLLVNNNFPKTVAANDIIDQINIAARSTRNALLQTKPEAIQTELARIPGVSKIITERFQQLEKTIASPEGKKLLENLQAVRRTYTTELAKLIELINAGKHDDAVTLLLGNLRMAQNEYLAASNKLIDFQTELVQKTGKHAEDEAGNAKQLILILALSSILLAIAFAFWLIRSITGPTAKVVDATNKMAAATCTGKT